MQGPGVRVSSAPLDPLGRSLASWLVGKFFVMSGYDQLQQPGSRGLPKRGSQADGRPPEREKEETYVNR